jgi:hypothetical protein
MAAIAAERHVRLKLNGRLIGYSTLGRFVELDFLAMGIEDKKTLLWNVRDLAASTPASRTSTSRR